MKHSTRKPAAVPKIADAESHQGMHDRSAILENIDIANETYRRADAVHRAAEELHNTIKSVEANVDNTKSHLDRIYADSKKRARRVSQQDESATGQPSRRVASNAHNSRMKK